MSMLRCWGPTIRGLLFRPFAAGLLVLLLGAAFVIPPAAGAAAASKQKSKKSTKKKKSAKKKKEQQPPPPPPKYEGPATPLQVMVRKLRATPSAANRAALAQYAASQKGVTGGLAFLALGIADVEHKQYATAPASLKTAQTRVPQLADYAAYWTGAANLESGNAAGAIQALEPIWGSTPDSPLLPQAAIVAGRAQIQNGNPAGGIALLRSLSARLPQPRGDALLAGCFEAAHDPQAAAAAWQHVYYGYPNAWDAGEASAALARLRTELGPAFPTPTSQMILSRAAKLAEGKQYATARRELEDALPLLPPAERDLARVRLGVITYQAGEYADAVRYLKSLEVKDAEADAERLFYIASSYRRTDNDEEFNRTLDRLHHYAKSPWRLQALVMAGNRYLMQNEPEKYERYYKAAYENFPGQPDGVYCHWKVVWLHYIQRRGDAEDYLRHHIKTFPATDKGGAALYFLGRLAETKNKPAAARGWYSELLVHYPNAYYALLARDRLAAIRTTEPPDPGVSKFLSEIDWPVRNQNLVFEPTPATKHRIERARLLQTAGLDDLAENELRYGARNEGPAPLLAMELAISAARRGSPDQGIRFIKGLVPDYLYLPMDAAPQSFWRLAFPLPYRALLEQNARQYEVDPFNVAALIRQESEFNPRALSYAKAYGLTQVVPATGRSLSKRVGLKRFSTAMLYRPDVNLKLGTYFLHSLLASFGGKWEPTLASYNAGKSRVDAWLTWANYKEPAEFIESIPITQTRDYVQIVMRNAEMYRRLYGSSTAAVTSTNGNPAKSRALP